MCGCECSLMLRRAFLEANTAVLPGTFQCLMLSIAANTVEHPQNFVQPRAGTSLATFPVELCRKMHSSLKDVIPPSK